MWWLCGVELFDPVFLIQDLTNKDGHGAVAGYGEKYEHTAYEKGKPEESKVSDHPEQNGYGCEYTGNQKDDAFDAPCGGIEAIDFRRFHTGDVVTNYIADEELAEWSLVFQCFRSKMK